jgi:osmotically-inducible protein OsmY
VTQGWITLEGTVDWNYQRMAAEMLVEDLMGVKGVTNRLTLKSTPVRADVKAQIESALKRNAEFDAKGIQVAVQGHKVILAGMAASMTERIAAERAAWKTAGVDSVINNIEINPNFVYCNVA